MSAPRMRPFLAALLALAGCQSSPFPDSMSPTQLQERSMDSGGQPLPYYDLDDGDNEDPCIDQSNYPNGGEPWWNSPGYIGG
jgi:hypothetical protein